LRDVEHAAAAVAAVTGLVAGHLDLASLPTLAADPVAELVGRFRRAHPGVMVRLGAPRDAEELADAVRSGAAEVGITEQGPMNAGLVEVQIGQQELFAVSPGRRGSSTPLRLDHLEGVPLVLSPAGSSLRDVVDTALAEAGVRAEVGVETAQRDALIPLVLAGAGTTFLPDTLARAAGRLGASVRPTRPRLRRTIALVHRPGDPGPAASRFLALAAT
jgi:DNA-binding transcriptional LysR family regulator